MDRTRRDLRVRFWVAALLLSALAPSGDARARQQLANIQASKKARQASGFKQWAQKHDALTNQPRRPRLFQRGMTWLRQTFVGRRGITRGPNTVPHGFVVYSSRPASGEAEQLQPSTVFNKADATLKRQVRRKAAKLRMHTELSPWQKVERIQQIIRARVSSAGDEISYAKNPNRYTRYNMQRIKKSQLAQLGDYLRIGKAVCREMAFLTQVALEDAGLVGRLVTGMVLSKKGSFGHAWNEVRIDGKWYVVDTLNPQLGKTDVETARTRGTGNGWIWHVNMNNFEIGPAD